MTITIKHGASKKNIKDLLKSLAKDLRPKGVDVYKYLGKIDLKEDALKIQKEARDDWE